MKILPKPTLDAGTLYDACTRGVRDVTLGGLFEHARHKVMDLALDYARHAPASTLHVLDACDHGRPEQIIVGTAVSKKNLNDLYSVQMVGPQGTGRDAYEKLLASAPLRKCPYCGLGQVSTLDHVLSKSRYPAFSILPDNLVPACADCNKNKGGGVTTQENMTLHPYFEPELLNQVTWLHATALDSSPVVVSFFISVPENFSQCIKHKLCNHFNSLRLGGRYSVEAASELVSIREIFRWIPQPEKRLVHLRNQALAEASLNRNSWKAATYGALVGARWFWSA